MDDKFYRAFEERFRGSREIILNRLRFYLPLLRIWANHMAEPTALDLGCGRGEWLELLVANGFNPIGYDLDSGMLEACKERNLPARQGDAIEALKNKPDESLAVVSGFHIIEHLSLELFSTVFAEAHRALMPGGLLILETPNSENLSVASSNFYLDPTHVKPVPAPLLAFYADHYGFGRTGVFRLQEDPNLLEGTVNLVDVLQGASPDYTVVAQKHGPADFLNRFDEFFETSKGISTTDLAKRFDSANARRSDIESVEADIREIRTELSKHIADSTHLRGPRVFRMLKHFDINLRHIRQL